MITLKILAIIIAAISKAIADTISPRKNHKFRNLGDFWQIEKQGKMLPFTKYPLDGWHVFNSLLIISLISATVFHTPYPWWVEIPALGLIFILIFNLVYNKFLK